MEIIIKPWGKEEILEKNNKYVVKRLTMNSNCKCSLQYHENKKETIYVLSGTLYVHLKLSDSINLNTIILSSGEFITIDPYTIHRMEAKENQSIYLELSTIELDDVVRIEDDYNRI